MFELHYVSLAKKTRRYRIYIVIDIDRLLRDADQSLFFTALNNR